MGNGNMEFQMAIHQIEKRLSSRRPRSLLHPQMVPAAVLIPVFPLKGEAHLLFTVRTDEVEHHKGQVSFPGGARDPHDRSLEETALRETYEEVGITAEHIRIIGCMDDFPTISNFLVTPFVASLPEKFNLQVNAAEVERVIQVPLGFFLSGADFEVRRRKYLGRMHPVYYYHHQEATIWGITAAILKRFLEVVFDDQPVGSDR